MRFVRRTARGLFLFAAGLLMVPFCAAGTRMTVALFGEIQPSSYSAVPASAWAFAIGFLLWLGLYATMPKLVRTYVLAHELTHALWGTMMGARITKMKLSKNGGSIGLTKNNILITLAPYFFPLYTVMVLAGYGVLSLFFDVAEYEMFWLAMIGFTWSFHVTFTLAALLQRQSDIGIYGPLLSYALIYLLNVLGIGLWLVGVTSVTIQDFLECFRESNGAIWAWVLRSVHLRQ